MINREFLVSVLHLKGGNIVWNCAKDNITKEKYQKKLLDYVGLIINYFKKISVGGFERDCTGIIF